MNHYAILQSQAPTPKSSKKVPLNSFSMKF